MPPFTRSAALGLLASTVAASAGFNAASSKNVAVYWGQGSAQITLSEVCSDESVDIVNVAFVNGFPKEVGDYPATNFANACGAEYYEKPDGTLSGLLSSCPGIEPGIDLCHANGKKVLLSIGGGWPTDYYLPSKEVAEYFAEFLWGAFGPLTEEWKTAGKPRPFGAASVDGFDLDIESFIVQPPFPEYQYANYEYFVSHLKNDLFPTGPGDYYISAAPQCVIPDVRLGEAISKSHFDFIFAQFYNTPQCSTRAGYNGLAASSTTFTFDNWAEWLKTNSANPAVKLYLGMPAGVDGAPSDPTSYLTPAEANDLISFYSAKQSDIFGGVMLWEATVSSRNTVCDKGYSTWIKDILSGLYAGTKFPETCPSPSSSSSVASSTSTQVSSSTIVSTSASSTLISSSSSSSVTSSTVASSSTSSVVSTPSPTETTPLSTPYSTSETPSSVPYPTGSNSTSVPYPTGTGSSSVVVSSTESSSVVYPSETSSTIIYPTGGSSSIVYPTESSSVPYPTYNVSSTPAYSTPGYYNTTSGSVYPTSTPCSTSGTGYVTSSTLSYPEYTASSPSTPEATSSTPCTTSGVGYPSSSSPSYPEYSTSSSSPSTPEYTASSTTPCSTSGAGYPTSSSIPAYYASSSTPGYPVYPVSSPSVTSKPAHYTHPPSVTTTVITTTYVDICSTGLTTITITSTKTICPVCTKPTSKPGDVLEGWTTEVTVCGHCGPKTVTVTLTKPIHTPTEYPAYPTGPAYVPETPEEEGTVTSKITQYVTLTKYPVPESEYTPAPSAPVSVKEYTPAPSAPVPASEYTPVVTLTKYPVPASEYTPAPSAPANGTGAYVPSGTASSTGSGYGYTYTPAPFEGAASRVGGGLSVVAVLVVGVLLM